MKWRLREKTAMRTFPGLILAVFMTIPPVFADPCPYIDAEAQKDVWAGAVRLWNSGREFIFYCATCTALPTGIPVRKILLTKKYSFEPNRKPRQSFPVYMSATIRDEAVDLANIYLRTGPVTFSNLALMLGCPSPQSPPLLHASAKSLPDAIGWSEAAADRASVDVTKKKGPYKQ